MSTRRDFLAFTAGAVAAKTVLPIAAKAEGAHPDADLLTACTEHLHIQREFEAFYDTLSGDMEMDDPHFAMLEPLDTLEEQIIAAQAVTAEGIMARARCAAFYYLPNHRSCRDDPDHASEERFASANLRDVVRMVRSEPGGQVVAPAAALPAAVHPDAELLAACEAFDNLERAYVAQAGGWMPGSPEEDAAEAERARLATAQQPLVDRICELQAVTREGQAARARSLALWDAELMKPGKIYTGDRLTAAIVRDLLAVGGA